MAKIRVAVAMGGYSSEVGISLQSGDIVCKELDKGKYQVIPVHLLKDGWYYLDEQGNKAAIFTFCMQRWVI